MVYIDVQEPDRKTQDIKTRPRTGHEDTKTRNVRTDISNEDTKTRDVRTDISNEENEDPSKKC